MSNFMTRLLSLLLLAKITVQQQMQPTICDCGFTDDSNNNWAGVWHADFSKYKENIDIDKNYDISTFTVSAKHANTFDRVYSKENVVIHDDALQISVTVDNGDTRCGAISTSR